MMISEVFFLTSQLEALVHKKYRLDISSNSKSIFIDQVKKSPGSLAPHFVIGNVHFYQIRRNEVFIVATSKAETSPIMVIELLSRLYHIFKDFCGIVNDDSLRANILLISELLDEIMVQGYVQLASTDKLRPFIQHEPVVVHTQKSPAEDLSSRVFGIETRLAHGSAAIQPAVKTERFPQKNEMFVDVIERMTTVINKDGTITRTEINGSINMKNFLHGDSPQIRLALNNDLVILGSSGNKGFSNQVQIDRCTFHQCVKLDEFQESRILTMVPPVGEFSAMMYTVSGEMAVNQPFTVLHFLADSAGHRDVTLTLRMKSNIPSDKEAVGVAVRIPLPDTVTSMSQQLSSEQQSAQFREKERDIVWKIPKFPGKAEMIAHFRLINQGHTSLHKNQIGPITLDFEISGYTSSGLNIRSLKIIGRDKDDVPQRWVRLITVSDSYVIRM